MICSPLVLRTSPALFQTFFSKRWQLFQATCVGSLLSSFNSYPFQVISISSKGPYYPSNCIKQGSILSSAHLCRNQCGAVPFPARRWFNQFPCSALEFQLLGDASRRHLYSTQVYSTQLASPLGKRRRTEEKVTLLAKLIDLTSICSINTT